MLLGLKNGHSGLQFSLVSLSLTLHTQFELFVFLMPGKENTQMSTLTKQPRDFTAFEKATSRWGPITMLIGLVLSLITLCYLIFISDLQSRFGQIRAAYATVASAFLAFTIAEPLPFFPLPAKADMYQASIRGNISNTVLPAAVVAQETIDAQPGS